MLIIAHSMNKIHFPQLMEVYEEGNLENGREFWPEEPPARQLQLAEDSFRDYLTNDFFKISGAAYFLWQVDGKYVSALRMEPYKDAWLLEALETHPRYRRRGYAEMLLRSVLALPEYKKIYSHVHKKNVPSLRIHEKVGFVRISEQATYIDGSVNSRCCTWVYPGEKR